MADRNERRVIEIRVDSKEFKQATKAINDGLKGIQKQARGVGNSLKAAFAIVGVHELIQWGKGIVAAMSEVERLDKVLEGASASQEEFAESLNFVRETAEEYGLNMLLLEEGFAHFMAAGKQAGLEMEAIQAAFEGLSISAAAFQVSGTELQLMLQGARQLMGSTTVNMEDLRQVTERLPGSIGAAVGAVQTMTGDLNLNAQEMKKLISEGKIATDVFFPLFTQRLEEMNLKGAAANSDTFRAALNRLNNATDDLARDMGPLLDVLTEFVKLVTQSIGVVRALITNVGDFQGTVAALSGTSRKMVMFAQAGEELYEARLRLEEVRSGATTLTSVSDAIAEMLGAEPIDREAQALRGYNAALERHNTLQRELETERLNREFKPVTLPDVPEPDLGGRTGGARGGAGGGSSVRAATQEVKDYSDEIRSLREEFDPLLKIQNEHLDNMDLLAKAYAAGNIGLEDWGDLAAKSAAKAAAEVRALNDEAERATEIAEELADTFVDAFDAMIFGGESFRDVLRSLEQQLVSMIAQNLFFDPLSKALAGSDLFGWVASAVAPRQFGGPVEANTPYLVGERGPELMIPSQSGTVVPNDELMGAGPNGVSVVMNFNGPVSGEGLRQSASQLAAQVGAQTQRALFRNG